jgi:hypothetical protein
MVLRLDPGGVIETRDVQIDPIWRPLVSEGNLRAAAPAEFPLTRTRRSIRGRLAFYIGEAPRRKTRPGENRATARSLAESAVAITGVDRIGRLIAQPTAKTASGQNRLRRRNHHSSCPSRVKRRR